MLLLLLVLLLGTFPSPVFALLLHKNDKINDSTRPSINEGRAEFKAYQRNFISFDGVVARYLYNANQRQARTNE